MRGERHAASRLPLGPSRFLLIAIVLVAAFLRLYRLDAQSLWNDEGNSARIAERSMDLIVEGAAGDVHPPGYYLLLHFWRGAFGQSEFALRSLSAVAGGILVALTYLVGRRIVNETTGLTAAFLGAVSPFGVYYSQEARMYALLAALSALSTLIAIGVVETASPERRSGTGDWLGGLSPLLLAAYVLANGAGLYTHYAFAFVTLAHNAFFGVWWLVDQGRGRVDWKSLTAWMTAQGALVLLYLPWLPTALGAAGWDPAGGGYDLGPALLDVLRVMVVGITLPAAEARAAIAAGGLLLVAGLGPWACARGRNRQRALLRGWGTAGLVIYLVVPVALFFAFDLYKPAWLKFLVVLLLPFHVIVASGGDGLARLLAGLWQGGEPESGYGASGASLVRTGLSVLILAPLLASAGLSLRNLAFNPAYFRDDYRQLAADIEAMRRPGDGIILNAPNQWEVFTYYYPDKDVYPAPYRPADGEAERFLTSILEEHERLFVLYWGDREADPKKRVESRLADRAYKAADRWYGTVRLATYGAAPLPQRPTMELDARFVGQGDEVPEAGEEWMLLRGYALAAKGSFGAGDVIPVTLFWEAGEAIQESYKVTLQLLDGSGNLVAQVDTVPRDNLAPTTLWAPGELIVDRYGVYVPDDLPAGQYSLLVAAYDAVTGERMSVSSDGAEVGDHLGLTQVTVTPQ